MTEKNRFLLGYAQKLEPVTFVSGSRPSPPPYTIEHQRQRLNAQFNQLDKQAAKLPPQATPEGQVVAVMRLHPSALSRSAFPELLLRKTSLRLLGSRPARCRPEGGRGHDEENGLPVTDLFVAGSRDNFRSAMVLLNEQQRLVESDALTVNLCSIENLRLMDESDRVKAGVTKALDELEVVLHYNATLDRRWRQRFDAFAKEVGVSLDQGIEFQRKDLLFMTASASRSAAEALAQFSFVRAVRPLPAPRPLENPKILRTSGARAELPPGGPVDPTIRMAIFDGGLPASHPFGKLAERFEPTPLHNIGVPVQDFVRHGIAVTSAALFDTLEIGKTAERPYCKVDHYRVLGQNTRDKKGLYRSLAMIDDVLEQREYDIISLSIGPPEPIDNDRVSAWTTLLDDHLSDGKTLGFVAVGNNGEEKPPQSRVMAPADSVNALGVGSCTAAVGKWKRASYSAMGPGRSPGIVKPEVVYFGGTPDTPFLFAAPDNQIWKDIGTSFCTPALARLSAGLKAHFRHQLSATAIKALLVHCAEEGGHSKDEVGFGRVPSDISALAVCKPGCVRVVYQGKLRAGGMIRAPLTVPPGLTGKLEITATVCFTCETDSNTPGNYTRSALEIPFRPDITKFNINPSTKKPSKHPATDSFFGAHEHLKEHERREQGQKWNTVMHASKGKYVTGLNAPCFDIHYVAREPGSSGSPLDAAELHYALVVSLQSKTSQDIYEQVLAAFPKAVIAIEPVIELQV